MPDRRVVIVAPTAAEALAEAEELGVPHAQQFIVTNRNVNALRGHALVEADVSRVRESGWSAELAESVTVCLMEGARR